MITVIGSLNYDLVSYTTRVPEGGETAQADEFEKHIGGKGLNEAIACARLSGPRVPVRLVGNVGNDMFGKELLEALKKSGVITEYVKTIDGVSSGVAVIIVESNGENRILITAGANGLLKPTEVEYKTYFLENSNENILEFVVLQNEYPHTTESIKWIKNNRPHINIAYNPSPFKPELITTEILQNIDLLIVNEGEAAEVAAKLGYTASGEDLVERSKKLAEKLLDQLNPSNCKTVIITLGSKGSVYTAKDHPTPEFIPAKKVEHVVDTTGAGDTFFGAVVLQLVAGNEVNEAIKYATVASSVAIQKKGAADSIPTAAQVEEELRR